MCIFVSRGVNPKPCSRSAISPNAGKRRSPEFRRVSATISALSHSNANACSIEIPRVAIFRAFFAASKLMYTEMVYIRIYNNLSYLGIEARLYLSVVRAVSCVS
jgi:hypothetical protein